MAEPGTYSILTSAQVRAIQEDAARICKGTEWAEALTKRHDVSGQVRAWAQNTGLMGGSTLTTADLAELVRLVWQIQNLNPMKIPGFLGSYGYAVHFQNYEGTPGQFRDEKLAEHPEWAQEYPSGGYTGADLTALSEDLRGMLGAIGTPGFPEAMARVIKYRNVGQGMLTGVLSLYAPDRCPLINNASIRLFQEGGRYALTKGQLSLARKQALARIGDVAEVLGPGMKHLLRWADILGEARQASGLDDFLAFDFLLYTVLTENPPESRAWLFQCDPKRYDLRAALAELRQLRPLIKQHREDIKVGDKVYLWESGPDGGILAVGTLEEGPAPIAEMAADDGDQKYWVDETEIPPDSICASLRIERLLEPMLSRTTIAAQPELAGLSILAQAQGTNFPVTPAQQAAIDALIDGSPAGVRYWKIAPKTKAEFWEWWRTQGIATIGWHELGDLTGKSSTEFKALKLQVRSEHKDWSDTALNQVWAFAHLRPGDRIVANRGTKEIVGVGTVTSPYFFVNENHGHRVQVRWEDRPPIAVNENGWRRTLVELSQSKFQALIQSPDEWSLQPIHSLPALAAETALDQARLEAWTRAIERKGQGILYGPPGTGKTFVARRLAQHLIGGGRGFMDIVQFHETYSYEDFMQGIRPETRPDGSLAYSLVPGRFMDFCREAARRGNDRCVLIIDEINRANLSRVFGELMFLLEYRDQDAPLAAGNRLRVPANVRIIGTMNTADRSIALVDHALRRRFAFLPLYPEFEILRRYHAGNGFPTQRLIDKLAEVNRAINDRNYAVGVSFFLRTQLADELPDIWRMEIEPYLEEFFFDQPDKAEAFRWERVGKDILG